MFGILVAFYSTVFVEVDHSIEYGYVRVYDYEAKWRRKPRLLYKGKESQTFWGGGRFKGRSGGAEWVGGN